MSTPARTGHPYYMYDEMQAQPDALAHLLAADHQQRDDLAKLLASKTRLFLTGCGTALHAALAGEHLLRAFTDARRGTRAFQAFEFERYGPKVDAQTALIVLSYSGTAMASVRAMQRAKSEGAFCLAITDFPNTPAGSGADAILPTHYPQQRSAVYTVSYTLMLALIADLGRRMARHLPENASASALSAEVDGLPKLVRQLLTLEPQVRQLAERYQARQRWWFLGGGPNSVTASEAALKMMEANYTHASGMQIEEFIHGPISSLSEQDVVVVIAPPGPSHERALDILKAAQIIGADTILLAEERDQLARPLATHTLTLPHCAEVLSPLPAVVPLQLLSYHLALLGGVNPDTIHRHDERYLKARQGYVR
jgi:glucosamine 6-phosphate synthetase-like amidotransferase/phosphosugar isomerase protein